MIEVKDLRFSYPGSDSFALRGVSFSLNPGERVAILGANGSGKTTFVQCLNGLLAPSSGEVWIDGFSISNPKAIQEIRRKVGMVFQNPDNQIVATTVVREIAFGLENIGIPTDEMIERVEEALTLFHLNDYRQTPPHLLSGGERQRLALASVWVMQPHYLVLDEPTSLLDPQGRQEIFRYLGSDMIGKNMGILMVTQFPEEALSFDRLVIMDRGMILFEGVPLEVFRHTDDLQRIGLGCPVEVELGRYLESK